jgi:3-oxoacyl-[acyl-carrier-protein] synthase III
MSQKPRAAITAVSGYVPEKILSNKDLETMVDTTDEWITSRTGIKERRIVAKGEALSDMGAKVVADICKKRGISPEEIELLVVGSITGDFRFPSAANIICDKAGLKNAWGFDVSAACSGFLYALTTATQFVENGTYKKVIVLGMDVMSCIIDYTDRNTCVIFGDGGGGVLLEPNTDGFGILDTIMRNDGSGREFLVQKVGGSLEPLTEENIGKRDNITFTKKAKPYSNLPLPTWQMFLQK